jgi:hypothetical protein
MFPVIKWIVRWTSIPVLLIVSMFSRLAGKYELPMDLAIWLGALFLVQGAVRSGRYAWAAGLGVVVIVFSPLLLVDKVFLFLGYTSIASLLTVATSFHNRPLPAGL